MWIRFARRFADGRLHSALTCAVFSLHVHTNVLSASDPAGDVEQRSTEAKLLGGSNEVFPFYRKAEISRHKTPESGVWVTYR